MPNWFKKNVQLAEEEKAPSQEAPVVLEKKSADVGTVDKAKDSFGKGDRWKKEYMKLMGMTEAEYAKEEAELKQKAEQLSQEKVKTIDNALSILRNMDTKKKVLQESGQTDAAEEIAALEAEVQADQAVAEAVDTAVAPLLDKEPLIDPAQLAAWEKEAADINADDTEVVQDKPLISPEDLAAMQAEADTINNTPDEEEPSVIVDQAYQKDIDTKNAFIFGGQEFIPGEKYSIREPASGDTTEMIIVGYDTKTKQMITTGDQEWELLPWSTDLFEELQKNIDNGTWSMEKITPAETLNDVSNEEITAMVDRIDSDPGKEDQLQQLTEKFRPFLGKFLADFATRDMQNPKDRAVYEQMSEATLADLSDILQEKLSHDVWKGTFFFFSLHEPTGNPLEDPASPIINVNLKEFNWQEKLTRAIDSMKNAKRFATERTLTAQLRERMPEVPVIMRVRADVEHIPKDFIEEHGKDIETILMADPLLDIPKDKPIRVYFSDKESTREKEDNTMVINITEPNWKDTLKTFVDQIGADHVSAREKITTAVKEKNRQSSFKGDISQAIEDLADTTTAKGDPSQPLMTDQSEALGASYKEAFSPTFLEDTPSPEEPIRILNTEEKDTYPEGPAISQEEKFAQFEARQKQDIEANIAQLVEASFAQEAMVQAASQEEDDDVFISTPQPRSQKVSTPPTPATVVKPPDIRKGKLLKKPPQTPA